jgi:hypothetical protein
MGRDEMSNLYRGPSIDASYQISDQLAVVGSVQFYAPQKPKEERREPYKDIDTPISHIGA